MAGVSGAVMVPPGYSGGVALAFFEQFTQLRGKCTIQQDESHAGRLVRAVGPGMVGAGLHHALAGGRAGFRCVKDQGDRKSVVEGMSGAVRVESGGGLHLQKKQKDIMNNKDT